MNRAVRALAVMREVESTLGIALAPEQSHLVVERVEASIAAGGPGWPEFVALLRAFDVFAPDPTRRRA